METAFIGLDEFRRLVAMLETGLHHRQFGRELRMLRQVTHAEVAAEHDFALVIVLVATYYIKECRLAGSVLGDEARALPFRHAERHVREEHQVTYGLRQALHVENGCCHN